MKIYTEDEGEVESEEYEYIYVIWDSFRKYKYHKSDTFNLENHWEQEKWFVNEENFLNYSIGCINKLTEIELLDRYSLFAICEIMYKYYAKNKNNI